jgi:hypothetical protein
MPVNKLTIPSIRFVHLPLKGHFAFSSLTLYETEKYATKNPARKFPIPHENGKMGNYVRSVNWRF